MPPSTARHQWLATCRSVSRRPTLVESRVVRRRRYCCASLLAPYMNTRCAELRAPRSATPHNQAAKSCRRPSAVHLARQAVCCTLVWQIFAHLQGAITFRQCRLFRPNAYGRRTSACSSTGATAAPHAARVRVGIRLQKASGPTLGSHPSAAHCARCVKVWHNWGGG